MNALAKILLLSLAFVSFFGPSAFSAAPVSSNRTSKPFDIIKKIKDLHDRRESDVLTLSCTSPGNRCVSSSDCCGASMCQGGYCSDPGTNNLPPGAHCQSSGDCEGSSMCEDGFCSDPGTNNLPPGTHCQSSGDCEGASMCVNNYCD